MGKIRITIDDRVAADLDCISVYVPREPYEKITSVNPTIRYLIKLFWEVHNGRE
jgi:hypothetical protein